MLCLRRCKFTSANLVLIRGELLSGAAKKPLGLQCARVGLSHDAARHSHAAL